MSRTRFDKQYARDMLRAVSEGLRARNPGVNVKSKSAKAKESASIRRNAKRVIKKARKVTKAPRAKRAATEKARSPLDPVKINVVDAIAKMMSNPNGASMAEMVSATGYDAHQMRAKIKLVRDRLKYTTTAPSKENGYRYFAVPPKAQD